jgi:hypothetical protein
MNTYIGLILSLSMQLLLIITYVLTDEEFLLYFISAWVVWQIIYIWALETMLEDNQNVRQKSFRNHDIN